MRSTFTTLILALLCLSGSAQVLGTAIPVADDNTYGKTRPRIVSDASGNPIVMWGHKTTDKVYVAKLNGNSFAAPVSVVPGVEQAFVEDWAGPDIASNGNDVFVTYHSQPEAEGFVYVVKSSDGGATFGDTVRAENIGADQSRFPVIAVDANGNPTVMFMRFTGNWVDPQYVVANSPNGGATYLDDVPASEIAPGEVCDCCPAALLSEGQRQVAMFRNNDNNLRDLWVTISNDNGADFDTGDDMDPNNWIINSCPSTGPDGHIDEDSLYTVWMSAGQGSSRVYLSSVHLPSATRGTTWEVAPEQNTSANQNYPRIAGDGQLLGVVYQQAASGNIDCYMAISTNGGASFGQPFLLHDATNGTQRNPDVTYANGEFHVVFEDVSAGAVVYRSVSVPVGISELEVDAEIWSANGNIHVQLGQPIRYLLELINPAGQLVYQEEMSKGSATIPVHDNGLYLLRLSNEKTALTKKLLLE
jgi:hypothetical protein